MMRKHGAFILARYSTDRQNEDTIEVQIEKCSAWCEAQKVDILDVFADLAVSGMKDSRPQYSRMMQELRAGGADMVVIYDQSRMFRKMTAWFEFRDELENMGVRVVSVTQPTIGGDLRDPSNFLIEGSMALFNQMWVLQTRQKVTEKMRYMAKNGKHTGGKPALGYKVVEGTLVIDEEEAEIVRMIFDMYASGSSYKEIIEELNRQGCRTKYGNPFGNNSLHDLLKNEKYIGTLVYGQVRKRPDGKRNTHGAPREDCIRIENGCPAIVDAETFKRVQERLSQNRYHGSRPNQRPQPLKGKVFCGECGGAMTIKYSGRTKDKDSTNAYYSCANKKRLHTCDAMPIRVDMLEQIVAEQVRLEFADENRIREFRLRIQKNRDSLLREAAPTLERLMKARTKVNSQLDRATDAILNGLSSETMIEKVQSLEREKENIELQIQSLRRSVSANGRADEEIEALIQLIMEAAHSDDAKILSLVVRVEVFPEIIKVWTILDDPNGPDSDDKATTKTVQIIVPFSEAENEHNSGCPATGTINYTHGQVIVTICMPRPCVKK